MNNPRGIIISRFLKKTSLTVIKMVFNKQR